ncbi:MAG: DUF4184 family protein [Hamadaea sp.]|nr:DUF4184 family protein [Hamadaea sp.]
MPLTLPSHTALPLPLKLWRPRWFDGVALVIGAASPDLAYALDGSGLPVFPLSHQWPGVVLFCLPVTLVCAVVVRWSAPVVAAHLPRRPGVLALRDYGVLGTYRPAVLVSVVSAVTAAASHLVWDRWTEHSPTLDAASTAGGALVTLALAVHVGRKRLLRTWHGAPPPRPTRPGLFWTVAVAVSACAAVLAFQLPGAFLLHTTGARLLIGLGLGLVAAAAVTVVKPQRPARSELVTRTE